MASEASSPASPERPAVSLVIPVYNEEESLPALFEALDAAVTTLPQPVEAVIVDDGSRDRSYAVLQEAAKTRPWMKVVRFRRNFGQTAGIAAGIDHSTAPIIVALDADLQNDPKDIPAMLAKLDEGFEVVSGWRRDRKDKAVTRRLPSVIANWLIGWVSGVRIHDYGCTLKAYRRWVLEPYGLYGEMHRFIPVYAYWNGARIGEVTVTHHARVHGVSKYGLERVIKVLFDLGVVLFLHRYAQKPIYVFGLCGLASWAFSAIATLAAVAYKILGEKSFIQTPLPLIAVTMFFTGVICFLMGLLAELSIRIYHESQDKTTYVVASRDNLRPPARRGTVSPFGSPPST